MAYTDTFTGADETELSAHNAAWVDAGDAKNLKIIGNEVTTTSTQFHAYYYNQAFNSKHYAKLKITAFRFIGPAIRMSAGQNYYYCLGSLTSLCFPGQVVAGSSTDWDSGQPQVNDNDILELAVDAATEGTIHYKVNGSVVQTYTGKTALSGGRAGIAAYSGDGPTGDDWEGGDVVQSASDTQPAFAKGQAVATGSKVAYARGQVSATSSRPAYAQGQQAAISSQSAYASGQAAAGLWPFSDDFAGGDGDPWDAVKWQASVG